VIVRTIASVRAKSIQAPFIWYGRQFLKLTHAVSRSQEFIADRVWASVAGAPAAASALKRVSVLTPLYAALPESGVDARFVREGELNVTIDQRIARASVHGEMQIDNLLGFARL
jgi:Zn-dependent protease with chaperone function